MKIVWICLLYMWSSEAPVTVVEVATKEDCQRVVKVHTYSPNPQVSGPGWRGRCVQVRKPILK